MRYNTTKANERDRFIAKNDEVGAATSDGVDHFDHSNFRKFQLVSTGTNSMAWRVLWVCLVFFLFQSCKNEQKYSAGFQNPALSFEERAQDLVAQMTLKEKVSQMRYDAPARERLGVPAYNWWNE